MAERWLFDDDHTQFRATVRAFVAREVLPRFDAWEEQGRVDRELFVAAGRHGLLGTSVDPAYGGGGVHDFRYNVVFNEELHLAGATGAGYSLTLQNDIVMPYFAELCSPAQQERWLPGVVSGELVAAVAMTEPGAGSDLAAMATTARRDGDCYVVNGAKTFITNAVNADLVVTAVRTGPGERHRGISLLVLEAGTAGFSKGRHLDKMGLRSEDTAELAFVDVRVPVANLIGEEGQGFALLMRNLAQERLSIAVSSLAAARWALSLTLPHCVDRHLFGQRLADLQNTRFRAAEMATEIAVTQDFLDRCTVELGEGHLTAERAAMAKWWSSEVQQRVVDTCLQLHGGYGYMREQPIARAYVDARVTRIFGGTTEVMKEIIGRSLFPSGSR